MSLTKGQAGVMLVMLALEKATDEELCGAYEVCAPVLNLQPQTPASIRSRRAELVDGYRLEDAGFKKQMSTGGYGRVWKLRPPYRMPH